MAVASVFSIICNVSVPYGITTPDQPNISSTRWRTVADYSRLHYFFESALTPNIFWVDMKGLDFSKESGKVQKLDLGVNQSNIFPVRSLLISKSPNRSSFLVLNKI
ncbi:penicillin V acylase-like amidase (Ntn superfamily) [Paenochrobactrum gallinarii]|uniref:Penicillin V acylase-like amidase (Ntn superfamily) n=1 Tax=Paenochrobactrum gallinarii TaxID=643673 RepID=A0A841LW54_9HYPH|nr:penicillin V acylase-like amidase (Ntn superfamily) [Paenochrobactrum gallinarii]